MNSTTNTPVLSSLRLSAVDIEALAQQGFVAGEMRNGRLHYKLRFRVRCKQHVRYLGTSPELASEVATELHQLQATRRTLRKLGRDAREVRSALRAAKQSLAPVLHPLGLHFHGLRLRKQRSSGNTNSLS